MADSPTGFSTEQGGWLRSGTLRLLIALTIAAVVIAYVAAEQTFHYWDYIAYQDMTLEKSLEVREAVQGGWPGIWNDLNSIYMSTQKDYSDLHALPIVPVTLLFGNVRLAYILGLALIYLLPYTLLTIALARRLVPGGGMAICWIAAGLTLGTPMIWLPTLRGYPDTAGAALVGLAALIFVDDMRLAHLHRTLGIGVVLALAVLVRRHFLYDVITFFVCLGLLVPLAHGLLNARSPRAALRALTSAWLRVALAGIITVAALCLMGWPFVNRLLQVDFGQLYSSYQNPADITIVYYLNAYGLPIVALAVLGLALGLRSGAISRPVAAFILIFGVVSMLQWCLLVQQLGFHYTLHFTLWLVLGLVALTWQFTVSLRGRAAIAGRVLLGLLYGLNAAIGLTPLGAGMPDATRWAFAASTPPEQRSDRAELERMVGFLRANARPDEPIFVAASSTTFSSDLLWHADRELYEDVLSYRAEEFWRTRGLNIYQWVSFADSRDDLPLEQLLGAQFVVLATPFQYHLEATEQDLLQIVLTIFAEEWPFAQDFVLLPDRFNLRDGVQVAVYRRIRPTSLETVIATHSAMVAAVGPSPNYSDWISIDATEHYITQSPNGGTKVILNMPAGTTASLMQLGGADAEVSGEVSAFGAACGTVSLQLASLSANGALLGMVEAQIAQETSQQPVSLQRPGSYTQLKVVTSGQADRDTCWVVIDGLHAAAGAR